MSVDRVVHIQLYSLKELPREARVSLGLIHSPYLGDDYDLTALKDLGICFFRDDRHAHGVIVDIPGFQPTLELRGVAAFKSIVIADAATLEPDVWVDEVVDPTAMTVAQYVEKHGDSRTWLAWNDPVHVIKFQSAAVRTA